MENAIAVPIQCVTVRADGGKTSDELQKEKAKAAQERSGNDLEVRSEKDEARRNRDLLKRVVFVVKDGKAMVTNVETGIADNTHIVIKSGIKKDDVVVSGSYAAISRTLKDGMKVLTEKAKKEDKK